MSREQKPLPKYLHLLHLLNEGHSNLREIGLLMGAGIPHGTFLINMLQTQFDVVIKKERVGRYVNYRLIDAGIFNLERVSKLVIRELQKAQNERDRNAN